MKEKTSPALNRVLILLGSNINPEQNIPDALHLLGSLVTIRKTSSIYQSPAIGSSGPDYLNSAVLIETDITIDILRNQIIATIETDLNRIRTADKYTDRTIDLDIIIFNQSVTDPELWTQAHVAIPASDILPNFQHPVTGEKISQAAKRLLPGINIQLRSDLSLNLLELKRFCSS